MKILHIMSLNERNGYNFFKQFNESFDLSDHRFIVVRGEGALEHFPMFKEFSQLEFIPKAGRFTKFRFLYKAMKEADAVIFHSLLFLNTDYLFVFALSKDVLRKSAWIEWGADLYNWYYHNPTFKQKIFNAVNKRIRENVRWVGVTFDGDKEEYERQFPANKVDFFSTPLPFSPDRGKQLESSNPGSAVKHYPDAKLRVQISHNSLQFNYHFTSLVSLRRFANEDMELFLPLSYGTYGVNGQYGGKRYLDEVVKYAKAEFPLVHVLKTNLPLMRYLKYLWTIDIAVFDSIRPVGLANINYLLAMGKKVYLPGNSPQYRLYRSHGVKVFDSRLISSMTFSEFAAPVDEVDPEGFVKDKFVPGKYILKWGDLLDAIELWHGGA